MPLPAHHVALMDGSSAVEVLIDILGYVDEVTLASSTRVCRAWRSLIWGDFLLRAKLFMLPVPTACPDECDDAKSLVYTLNPLLDWFATQSFLVQQTAGPVAAPLVGKEPFRIFSLLPNAQRAANALSDEGSTSLLNQMLLTQPRIRAVSLYLPIEWPYAQPLSISPIFEEYGVKNPNGVTLGDLLRCWSQAQCCVSKGLPVCLRLGAEGGGQSYMEDLQAEYYQLLNASDMRRNIGNVQQQTRDTRRLVRDMRREILQNELRPEMTSTFSKLGSIWYSSAAKNGWNPARKSKMIRC